MKRTWLQILIVGLLLFVAAEQALQITGEPVFLPTILLLGSFLAPVVFVAFFYEQVMHREISLPLLTTSAIVGGVIGIVSAGILEYGAAVFSGNLSLLSVSLIEELVKLAFPIYVYLGWRYRHEADGLLFGVAAGMGFAALETMGYGLIFLAQTGGDISGMRQLLVMRGLLSPAEHAAWTGYLCAVLWREREKSGKVTINASVLMAYVLVVVLHSLWNIVNSLGSVFVLRFNLLILGNIGVAAVSLLLLFYRYRKAKKAVEPEPVE